MKTKTTSKEETVEIKIYCTKLNVLSIRKDKIISATIMENHQEVYTKGL
jgi:hypothetical protein